MARFVRFPSEEVTDYISDNTEINYKMKKRQLRDRGFRRNSYLQAVWDTLIARTVLRVSCDLIEDVSPYWGEQNLTAVGLSECANKQYVAMDMYATLFILVGRNIIEQQYE